MSMLHSLCHRLAMLIGVCVLFTAAGCATYTTPGAGVSVGNLSQADADIGEILKREPAAPFPARVAVARVQAPGYSSRSNSSCYGTGQFCVLTTRDIESDQDFQRIAMLPMVSDLARMSRLLLPPKLDSTMNPSVSKAKGPTSVFSMYGQAFSTALQRQPRRRNSALPSGPA